MSKLEELMLELKGGSGSGNFGHAGRPGKHGGSAPKGGGGGRAGRGKTSQSSNTPPPKESSPAHAIVSKLGSDYEVLPSGTIRPVKGVSNRGVEGTRAKLYDAIKTAGYKPTDKVEAWAGSRVYQHPKTKDQVAVFVGGDQNWNIGKPTGENRPVKDKIGLKKGQDFLSAYSD